MFARYQGTISIGALLIHANVERNAEGAETHEITMPAGVPGELTARGGDTSGTITMAHENHGFETDDIVAVFWTDTSGAPRVMYGFGATVSGDEISIALGAGDYEGAFPVGTVLPSVGTAVIVALKNARNVALKATDVTFLGLGCDQPAVGVLGGEEKIWDVHVPVAFSPIFWDRESGAAAPLDEDTTTLVCYNGGLMAATFQFGALLNPEV